LADLSERLRDAEKVVDSYGYIFVHDFARPAGAVALDHCEQELGVALPPSLRAFLALHDGGYLGVDYVLGKMTCSLGITMFSCAAILQRTTEESLLPFVAIADQGNGELCLLDSSRETDGEYAVVEGSGEYTHEEWREAIIAESFGQWLDKVLSSIVEEHRTLHYWISMPLADLVKLPEQRAK
jgi:hypothetical protein